MSNALISKDLNVCRAVVKVALLKSDLGWLVSFLFLSKLVQVNKHHNKYKHFLC